MSGWVVAWRNTHRTAHRAPFALRRETHVPTIQVATLAIRVLVTTISVTETTRPRLRW
jgi:hypothetical protein